MAGLKEKWLVRQRQVALRKSWIRIDRVCLRHLWRSKGYAVAIYGIHLHAASIPPRIIVGDITLTRLRFHPEGRVIYGYLPDKPLNNTILVDLGFARDEVELKALNEFGRRTWRLKRWIG